MIANTSEQFRATTSTRARTPWTEDYQSALSLGIALAEGDLDRHSEAVLPQVFVTVEKRIVVERTS